jgi:hypothetical protein
MGAGPATLSVTVAKDNVQLYVVEVTGVSPVQPLDQAGVPPQPCQLTSPGSVTAAVSCASATVFCFAIGAGAQLLAPPFVQIESVDADVLGTATTTVQGDVVCTNSNDANGVFNAMAIGLRAVACDAGAPPPPPTLPPLTATETTLSGSFSVPFGHTSHVGAHHRLHIHGNLTIKGDFLVTSLSFLSFESYGSHSVAPSELFSCCKCEEFNLVFEI